MSGPVAGNKAGSLASDLCAQCARACDCTLGCNRSRCQATGTRPLNGSTLLRGRVLSGLARQSNSDRSRQKIVCYESKQYG
jgi:hypothetical protein